MYKLIINILILLLLSSPCFGQMIANKHLRIFWEHRSPINYSTDSDASAEWLAYYKQVNKCQLSEQATYNDNNKILFLGASAWVQRISAENGCGSTAQIMEAGSGDKVDLEAVAGSFFYYTGANCTVQASYYCNGSAEGSQYGTSPNRGDYDWIIMDVGFWDLYYHTDGVWCGYINDNTTNCTEECTRFIEEDLMNTSEETGYVYDFLDLVLSENTGVKIIFLGYYWAYGAFDSNRDCLQSHLNPALQYIAEDPGSSSKYRDPVFFIDTNATPIRPAAHTEYFMDDLGHPQYLYSKEIAVKIMNVINAN